MIIKRGEIWLANLDPTIGSEIQKTRPVLIVSNNINNQHNNTVTILPITSSTRKVFLFEVFISKGTAHLPKDSKIKAEQIRTIDKQRIILKIGLLPDNLLSLVDSAIKLHLAIK
jgi:mRNA interferase MazF